MATQKPSIPKGTRDFSPVEMSRRNYIFETIREVFKKYGFSQIETPAMENLSTLLGKYGDEGDKLLFRILNSGDFLRGVDAESINSDSLSKTASKISKRGLRYDLTVPFARYVVQHRNEIQFPFRRYQIQPVWRADNPQKGRYREFYQCDADIIGSDSLLNELELIQMVGEVFAALSLNVTIKINNRKILAGISEVIGQQSQITDITVALDKLDKIGVENVKAELKGRGISEKSLTLLEPVFSMAGSNSEKLGFLSDYLSTSEIGVAGTREVETLLGFLDSSSFNGKVELDITLARGLDYYTGAIIEVKADDVEIGSICGGGRYDDLTGIFGMPDVSGVGISFGADRIYDVLLQLDLFPSSADQKSQVMFVNFGDQEVKYILPILARLRKHNIFAELYPDRAKMKKQMSYANQIGIPYVVLVGEREMAENKLTLKEMESGEQKNIETGELINILQR